MENERIKAANVLVSKANIIEREIKGLNEIKTRMNMDNSYIEVRIIGKDLFEELRSYGFSLIDKKIADLAKEYEEL